MSDEEDFGLGAGGPMVIEVKGRSHTPRTSRSPAHNPNESDKYSEDERWSAEEDIDSDEESVARTQRSQRMSHRTPRKNGRSKINLTPPDKTLQTAEKKAVRFTENGKVDKVITELTKCLALNRILHGAGHWKLARSHGNLAEAYLDLKAAAEKYLNECVATCQTIHGPHHKQSLAVQDKLARLYIRMDRNGICCKLVSDWLEISGSVIKKCHDIECLVLGEGHKKAKDTERTTS